jgi:hypothetical protein
MSDCTRCGTAVASDHATYCPDCRTLSPGQRRSVPVEVSVTRAEAALARERADDPTDEGEVMGHLLDLVELDVTYVVDGEPLFGEESPEAEA